MDSNKAYEIKDSPPSDEDKRRDEFLSKMYDQMWNNINRHILVVWQSVGVLVGAFAVFALVEKNIISIDIASSLLVLISAWLIAHLFDANAWYNRNLAIIANIERQFLKPQDACYVHYYFTEHRKSRSLLDQFQIQLGLGVGIYVLVVIYHFTTRVLPGFGRPLSDFQVARSFPYLISILSFIVLAALRRKQMKAYEIFLRRSPGAKVDMSSADCRVHAEHS
jgi:hypothetical protein